MSHDGPSKRACNGLVAAAGITAITMLLGLAVRTVLIAVSEPQLADVSRSELGRALWTGARIDLLLAGYLVAPLALAWLIAPLRSRRLVRPYVGAAVTILVLGHMCDLLFFGFYGYRMSYLVLDYAGEVEVWRTLAARPAVWTGLLVVVGLSRLGARTVIHCMERPRRPILGGVARLALLLVATLACRGTLDHRPLNPSFASISSNRLVNEVAGSGLFTLGYEIRRRASDESVQLADLYEPLPPGEASGRLERIGAERSGATLPRASPAGRPRNVVVVVMESFTGRLVGSLGGDPALSPSFDALARDGLLMTHCYATGERTVQGLEAVVASFPPLPGVSVIRRPEAAGRVETLASVLRRQGYDTLFAYGGQGIFDHMRSFFLASGFDRFIEERDFDDASFHGSWGVSDEDLFRRLNRELQARYESGRPFLAVALTVSLHSPWEIPPGQAPRLPFGTEVPEGFERDELASFLYADHAVGELMREARTLPYFDDTLFVFVGDHGVHLRGRTLVPSEEYRVPLLLYSPAHLRPERSDQIASQVDVAPTILGILGAPPASSFSGRDLRSTPAEAGRALLVYRKERYAVRRPDRLVVLGPAGVDAAYRVEPDGAVTPIPQEPSHVEDARDALAILETAERGLRRTESLLSRAGHGAPVRD